MLIFNFMLMRKSLLIVLIYSIISCTGSKSDYLGRKDYKMIEDSDFKEVSLTSKPLSFLKDQLIKPSGILLVGDFLIVKERRSDQVLHVINLKKEEYTGIFVNKGEGAREIKSAWAMSKIDETSFIISDVRQRKYLCYTIDDLVNSSTPFKEGRLEQRGFTNTIFYNKNLGKLFYTGQFSEDFLMLEKDLKSGNVTGYGTLLDDASYASNSIVVKNHLSHATSSSNFDNTFFVFAYRNAPIIENFDYKTNKLKTIVLPNSNEPIYKAIKNDSGIISTVAVLDETIFHFNDVFMTDKYIYALYKGNTFKNWNKRHNSVVYVFDLELNPIKKYNLDIEILSFEIKDDAILYGLDIKTDIYPSIVQFDLD